MSYELPAKEVRKHNLTGAMSSNPGQNRQQRERNPTYIPHMCPPAPVAEHFYNAIVYVLCCVAVAVHATQFPPNRVYYPKSSRSTKFDIAYSINTDY